jgi:hypothetical protein
MTTDESLILLALTFAVGAVFGGALLFVVLRRA